MPEICIPMVLEESSEHGEDLDDMYAPDCTSAAQAMI
jgi:hypothetical protein